MEGMDIGLAAAFSAGLLSFFSPCVLPLLPAYAAILAGGAEKTAEPGGNRRFLVNAAAFFSGFALVFVAMGAAASLIGQIFWDHQEFVRKAGGVFIAFMGLVLSGMIRLPALARDMRLDFTGAFRGPAGAFFMGVAFTAGWTPCTGPVLASLLVYAGTSSGLDRAGLLLTVFALGFCLPFLTAVLLINWRPGILRPLYPWLPVVQQIFGLILAASGVLIYLDLMQRIPAFF